MLSPDRLRAALAPLYQPGSMPSGDAVGDWARMYVQYANDATAGPTKLAVPLVPQGLPGAFPSALDGALRAMWMRSAWVGPGVTGVTALVPPLMPFLLANQMLLLQSYDRQLAIDAITQSIHTYTLSITVTVTTAAGVTSVVPLV